MQHLEDESVLRRKVGLIDHEPRPHPRGEKHMEKIRHPDGAIVRRFERNNVEALMQQGIGCRPRPRQEEAALAYGVIRERSRKVQGQGSHRRCQMETLPASSEARPRTLMQFDIGADPRLFAGVAACSQMSWK